MTRSRVTINDIATHAGVSRSTVSLVLQGHPRIPDDTKQRVQASISALGYTYNRAAANLRRQTSQAIGLVINDIRNPFFAELTSGIEEAVAQTGYFVYLVESGENPERQQEVLLSLMEHGVAGLVLCPATGTTPPMLDRLHAMNMPVCIAVRPHGDSRFDYAGPDHVGGGSLATQHLIDQGHRRIAFIGGQAENPARRHRLAGYFATLQSAGIELDPRLIVASRPSLEGGEHDLSLVMQLEQRPTALICYNDFVGMAVMHALRKSGLVPGEDVAVVSFDGMPETAMTFPPLSTVAMHGRLVGRRAAELLMARIAEPGRAPSQRIENVDLMARESSRGVTARAPQSL